MLLQHVSSFSPPSIGCSASAPLTAVCYDCHGAFSTLPRFIALLAGKAGRELPGSTVAGVSLLLGVNLKQATRNIHCVRSILQDEHTGLHGAEEMID